MNISRKSPIATIGQKPPVRRLHRPDGTIVDEKIPATPYARKFVTPSGNVVRVPLATGRTLGQNPAENPYGMIKMAEKFRKGFLLYAECPYATNRLQTPDGVTPCAGTNPGTPGAFWRRHEGNPNAFVEDECCEHIEQIIAERQEIHSVKQHEISESFKTPEMRLVEAMHAERQDKLQAKPTPPPRPSGFAEAAEQATAELAE